MLNVIKKSSSELLLLLAVVVVSIIICCKLLSLSLISNNLFDNLIGGIVSAGIIGFFVSFILYMIQEKSQREAKRHSSEIFFETQFLPDVRELFSRRKSNWNVNGGKKFYFDRLYVNSIYDLYEKYRESIHKYRQVFPKNSLVVSVENIHNDLRKGYVIGEKIDQYLSTLVRLTLAPKGIDEHMDVYLIRFLKMKLFSDAPTDLIIASIGITPYSYYEEEYKKIKSDKKIKRWQKKVKMIRISLHKDAKKVKRDIGHTKF